MRKISRSSGIPALSIVVTARNDNHGGDLLGRMQRSIDGICRQAASNNCRVELIVVEWNPVAGVPRLHKALSWKVLPSGVSVRVIEVPLRIHRRYRYWRDLSLYQMIAKNVGIRRASADFILATNIDILFSDEMFAFLASGKLQPKRLYRCDRYDIDGADGRVVRINTKMETKEAGSGKSYPIYSSDKENGSAILHTNACGDFQLLDRDSWFALRGYPELDIFSLHIDSLFEYVAYHAGCREESLVFPRCIYHIEHQAGWKPKLDKSYKTRFRRVRKLTSAEMAVFASDMYRRTSPIIFNDRGWGSRKSG
jgi:hypothetical protein